MRWWLIFAALAGVAACALDPDNNPGRFVIGVSGDRLAGSATPENDAAMHGFLDRKANAICTLGYDTVHVNTLAAEESRELVNEELRCKPYRLSLF